MTEDIGLILDEIFTKVMLHEILVDKFDTDGLFIFVGGFVDLSSATLTDFRLNVIGLTVV